MRIGIDVTSLAGGRGPARYTTEIIKALSKSCKQDDIVYLYSPFEKKINGLPSNFVFRKLPLEQIHPWLNWILPRTARRDEVQIMFFPANDFWLWRATPAVVTLLDIASAAELFEYLPSWKDRLQIRLQMRRLGKIADRVITISRFSARSLISLTPEIADKLGVIYCGLSNVFTGTAGGSSDVPPFILFVGGFDRRKNLERLLQAYRQLVLKGRTEKLILVGSSGKNRKLYYDMPEIIASCGLQNSVKIEEGVDDFRLSQIYSRARLLVLPSTVEGFGLPVLEAMACGCPVVASKAASIPEVGGDAAVYFDPYNIAEIASCMERVLDDEPLRQEMISKGLTQADQFSWSQAGKAVYGILDAVAGCRRRENGACSRG